jgi:hypothetical protein
LGKSGEFSLKTKVKAFSWLKTELAVSDKMKDSLSKLAETLSLMYTFPRFSL